MHLAWVSRRSRARTVCPRPMFAKEDLLDLNPSRVLAAVRQRGAQEPDADAHAGVSGVEIKFPLPTVELKLISGRGGAFRGRINWVAGSGRIGVFDDL